MALDDMFLKIEGARLGPIKGESLDQSHKDEIDVLSWKWGMRAQTDLSGAGRTGKAALNNIVITKKVDSASCALMSVMRNNDLIKKAKLTVRKAGGKPVEYLKIEIEKGRITSLDLGTDAEAGGPALLETLHIAFQKINVEYVPQGGDGQQRGSMNFETEIDVA